MFLIDFPLHKFVLEHGFFFFLHFASCLISKNSEPVYLWGSICVSATHLRCLFEFLSFCVSMDYVTVVFSRTWPQVPVMQPTAQIY